MYMLGCNLLPALGLAITTSKASYHKYEKREHDSVIKEAKASMHVAAEELHRCHKWGPFLSFFSPDNNGIVDIIATCHRWHMGKTRFHITPWSCGCHFSDNWSGDWLWVPFKVLWDMPVMGAEDKHTQVRWVGEATCWQMQTLTGLQEEQWSVKELLRRLATEQVSNLPLTRRIKVKKLPSWNDRWSNCHYVLDQAFYSQCGIIGAEVFKYTVGLVDIGIQLPLSACSWEEGSTRHHATKGTYNCIFCIVLLSVTLLNYTCIHMVLLSAYVQYRCASTTLHMVCARTSQTGP